MLVFEKYVSVVVLVVIVKFAGLKLMEESLPSTTYKDKEISNIPVSKKT